MSTTTLHFAGNKGEKTKCMKYSGLTGCNIFKMITFETTSTYDDKTNNLIREIVTVYFLTSSRQIFCTSNSPYISFETMQLLSPYSKKGLKQLRSYEHYFSCREKILQIKIRDHSTFVLICLKIMKNTLMKIYIFLPLAYEHH